MKYALSIAATTEQFTAAYVAIHSFKKYHKDADILFYGDKPDMILDDLGVNYVEVERDILDKKLPKLYLNSTCVIIKGGYDAYVISRYDTLFNRNIEDYIKYAIDSKRVVGATLTVDNKLELDTSMYIVPTNVLSNKIYSTIMSGCTRDKPESMLIDSYYPILDDSISYDMLKVEEGTFVKDTDKAIIQYAGDSWKDTPEGDLWTKYGEELIEELSK